MASKPKARAKAAPAPTRVERTNAALKNLERAHATKPAAAAPPPTTEAPAATNMLVIKDPALIARVEEYAALQKQAKAIEDRIGELKPELKAAMGEAPVAYAGSHVLSLNVVPAIPETPNRIITAAMVGQVIPGTKGRAAYKQLTVR